MKKKLTFLTKLFAIVLLVQVSACKPDESIRLNVSNPIDLDRKNETISIEAKQVSKLTDKYGIENLLIKDEKTGQPLVRQLVDNDLDGSVDEILVQVDIKANEKMTLVIEGAENGSEMQPESQNTTFSRFVPERIDDYAWENDRVAFRTYGPVAQKLFDEKQPGGTSSSGFDCWLKRVEYPVIDDWYSKNLDDAGYYHIDHGEGYDPYHVGTSRGCGGLGIFLNDTLYFSKNFSSYKTIADGPIRTIFELTYEPWNAGDIQVQETKRISLDLGSNMMRVESELTGSEKIPAVAIGITLHDKSGATEWNEEEGWFTYWETIDDSKLGTAVVLDPVRLTDSRDFRAEEADRSHLFAFSDLQENKVEYYAGFGWQKSGQFKNLEDWKKYLGEFSKRKQNELQLTYQ